VSAEAAPFPDRDARRSQASHGRNSDPHVRIEAGAFGACNGSAAGTLAQNHLTRVTSTAAPSTDAGPDREGDSAPDAGSHRCACADMSLPCDELAIPVRPRGEARALSGA